MPHALTVNDSHGTIVSYVKHLARTRGRILAEIDAELLGQLVTNKRDQRRLSLRDAAAEIGVSAPTLQRLEKGSVPAMPTLLKLVEWLGVSLDQIRATRKHRKQWDTMQQVEILLRADADLDADAAETIANVARQIYDEFKRKKNEK